MNMRERSISTIHSQCFQTVCVMSVMMWANMEHIQDCQAKCQIINAVSSLDRALDTGNKYKEQKKRKWNMVVGSQSLVRTLVYQKSRKQRTKRKQMGQKTISSLFDKNSETYEMGKVSISQTPKEEETTHSA